MSTPASDLATPSPVLAGAPVAIVGIDLLGHVSLWNEAATELFGWTEDEVLDGYPPFVGPDKIGPALDAFARVLDGKEIEHERYVLLRRDGTYFDGLVSASLLHDEQGKPLAALVVVRDVTGETAAELRRNDVEQRWRTLALHAVDSVSFANADGVVMSRADHLGDALGYPPERWEGGEGFSLIHPEDIDFTRQLWEGARGRPGALTRGTVRARHARGHYEQLELTAVNLLEEPAVRAVVVGCRVISPQQQASRLVADEARVLELVARDEPLATVLEAIVGVVEQHTDHVSGIVLFEEGQRHLCLAAAGSMSDALREVVEDVITEPLTDQELRTIRLAGTITDLETDPRAAKWGHRLLELGYRSTWIQPIVEARTSNLRGNVNVWVTERRKPSRHDQRVIEVASHLVAVALERSGWQQELTRQARSDELTGLPNRTGIFERLDATLAEARVQRKPVTAMVIDVDRFKLVNDSLGHDLGDQLLVRFAERVRAVIDDRHLVGRMAADELVVVFAPGVRLREAKEAARDLRRALEEPFTDVRADGVIGDEDIHLTVSIGLAMSTMGRENADSLLQRADAAMFRAKAAGRDRVEVYDERLRTRAVKRLEIDRELRVALERGELQLYYQPEIDCRTERIVGAEALLRWQHPTRGLIHPEGFINVAEESGSIVPIGHWVLDEAVRQARTWTDAHPHIDPFCISVNLSARQLINRSLVDTVAFVLTRYDWPPSNLTLELTESILIEDRDATLYVLSRLRMLGVKLAIDDFGTGFASLDYLHRLHVDWIKIDRSFVRMLDAEGNGSPVATAMMHMARAFELEVIAEGVEEPRQLEGLRTLGCDVVQGYLFAKPLPPDELEVMLRDQGDDV